MLNKKNFYLIILIVVIINILISFLPNDIKISIDVKVSKIVMGNHHYLRLDSEGCTRNNYCYTAIPNILILISWIRVAAILLVSGYFYYLNKKHKNDNYLKRLTLFYLLVALLLFIFFVFSEVFFGIIIYTVNRAWG
jgi:hypothetical protein